MHKTYVTFGQEHIHKLGLLTFDKDCVAIIKSKGPEEGREKAFELFGPKFCIEYPEQHWDDGKMKYFPRGYIDVDGTLPESSETDKLQT